MALLGAGCATRLNTVPVSLMTRSEPRFLAAVGQLMQTGDLTQQAAVEGAIGAPLALSREQPAMFGEARYYRPAPGSLAARAGVIWENVTLDASPPRPTRVASLEISSLEPLVCVDEQAVTKRFPGYAIQDTSAGVTVYSGPGQEGEFYVRFTRGTGERCFVTATLVQNSSRS